MSLVTFNILIVKIITNVITTPDGYNQNLKQTIAHNSTQFETLLKDSKIPLPAFNIKDDTRKEYQDKLCKRCNQPSFNLVEHIEPNQQPADAYANVYCKECSNHIFCSGKKVE